MTTPGSKLVKLVKTGQIVAHKYNTDHPGFSKLVRNWSETGQKLVIPSVTSVTQITESLPTRHTKWYNGWYNNQLKES